MSDSASDRNVEDVLSSVRRLVSNELPRMPRPAPQKPSAALVLTEAHRIPEAPAASQKVRSTTLEERIAELEAAVSARTDEWEPDGSEDQELHRPRRIVYTRPPTEDEKSGRSKTLRLSQIALIDTGPADESESGEETTGNMTFQHGKTRAEPLELTANDAISELKPEPEAVDAESEDGAIANVLVETVEGSIADMAVEALGEDEGFDEALADAVARSVEVTSDEAAQEAEDEPFTAEAEHGSAPIAIDVEAEETVSEPISLASRTSPVITAADVNLEDLQPLVASLIRAELQGELGERITRNVRKLVRREINRALSGRELE